MTTRLAHLSKGSALANKEVMSLQSSRRFASLPRRATAATQATEKTIESFFLPLIDSLDAAECVWECFD